MREPRTENRELKTEIRKLKAESRKRRTILGSQLSVLSYRFSAIGSLFSVLCFLFLSLSPLFAQPTQFYLEDTLGPGMQTKIYVINEPNAKAQVQEALYAAVDHARQALEKMQSELADINAKKSKGSFMISEELAKALQAGLDLSDKTDGRFDMTGTGAYKKMDVSVKNNSLKLSADNIEIDLKPLLKGFLADGMADDLVKSGFNNCFVKIGAVYVTRGADATAPWTIPVVIPSEKSAKKVYYYKTKQAQAAGATWAPIEGTSDLKSVTIFSKNGASSEGLATAIFKMGADEGRKFLSQNKNLRGVFIDNEGKLTPVP